jgi:hypothetical protein
MPPPIVGVAMQPPNPFFYLFFCFFCFAFVFVVFFFGFLFFLPCVKMGWHFYTRGAILLGLTQSYAYVSQFQLKTLMASVRKEGFDTGVYLME